jgi:Protein of unknown function (DUF3237)
LSLAGTNTLGRHTFLDKALLYLFSYDVETEMDREEIGFVAGGVRVNLFARDNLSRVYHVMRERTVPGLGFQAINGTLSWGGDWLLWREDDVEFSEVKMTIKTDDGATIHCSYPVVAYLGVGGFRRIVSEREKIGKERAPVELPAVTTPRFETTSPNYRWINEVQCVGFGRVQVIRTEVRRLTYDVYALT